MSGFTSGMKSSLTPEWIVGHATEVRFVRGRLKFGDSQSGAPFPSAIVVYDMRPRRWWVV